MQKILYAYIGKAKDFKLIEVQKEKDLPAATEKVQEKNID